MKANPKLPLLTLLSLLACCSGSDVYQGNWKATDVDGNKFDIHFESKSISIKDMKGHVSTVDYTQNSVAIKNSIKSYGLTLSDGRAYTIRFPIADNTDKGIILLDSNLPMYTIDRSDYIEYKDLYTLTK